jgi:hypothetical protein
MASIITIMLALQIKETEEIKILFTLQIKKKEN